jgi:hypothetical protein
MTVYTPPLAAAAAAAAAAAPHRAAPCTMLPLLHHGFHEISH